MRRTKKISLRAPSMQRLVKRHIPCSWWELFLETFEQGRNNLTSFFKSTIVDWFDSPNRLNMKHNWLCRLETLFLAWLTVNTWTRALKRGPTGNWKGYWVSPQAQGNQLIGITNHEEIVTWRMDWLLEVTVLVACSCGWRKTRGVPQLLLYMYLV